MPRLPKASKRRLRGNPGEASPEGGALPLAGAAGGFDVGLRLLVAVLGLGAGGFFLDRWLGTLPWLMLLGGVLGFGGWMVGMVRATGKGRT